MKRHPVNRLNKKLATILVGVVAATGAITIAVVDTRSRAVHAEELIDPCAGLLTNALSAECKARTCTRLHSVGATHEYIYAHFPLCRSLLPAAERGELGVPEVEVVHPDAD